MTLQDLLAGGVLSFILIFVRIGTAMMIMPGIGDSFVPQNVRLYIALSLSLVLAPVMYPYMPSPIPALPLLFVLIVMEFVIGIFFGTIARILMLALDTAGMVISMASGLSNAQLFNPIMATQGSIVGAFLSVTGVLVLFASDMHHLMFQGLAESYTMFPIGAIPDTASMADMISRAIAGSFLVGVQIGAPFLTISLLLYVGMGVLSRLMPQLQVFLLALPVQILISLVMLTMVLSASMLFWLAHFQDGMVFFLTSAN